MSANRVCWSRTAIDYATQVDVGGLDVDDPRADAVFRAIHQPLPVSEESGSGRAPVTEEEVLQAFTRPITSNEPLLLFVTGEKGTGKSHLVRWLKSQLGARPSWHIVYIEKRNTSLRRVIERILDGINTDRARALRQELERASSEITSDAEAMNALLARLDHLVAFDQATEIGSLPDLSAPELQDLRRQAHRLLGDFTFRRELSVPDGPVERIVRLARIGDPSEGVNDADLHLTEADLRVDPSRFEDEGQELQNLIASLVSTRGMRTDIAALCDWYLARAKAQVFMGQSTNLLDVFEDVREEIARRGEELCLLVEDLVLLHGIDRELAQALTIPASGRLCRLRAAIAVTSGYLKSMDTFTDRGLRFTLDMKLDAIGQASLRDFVGRYLNAGRLLEKDLDTARAGVPNACFDCPLREPCHSAFGASGDHYGLYPLNATAVDRLIAKASPGEFRPREILRQVIRAPLEVAEEELPAGGTFPSERFARTLDPRRSELDPTVRDAIRKLNKVSPEAEISLRAFYSRSAPAVDIEVEEIARYLGDQLTEGLTDTQVDPGDDHIGERTPAPKPEAKQQPDEVRRWTDDPNFFLPAPTAHNVRKWVCETLVTQLQNGPYGVAARKVREKNEWRIGSYTLRLTDVRIERAQGSGAVERQNPFCIDATDENASVIRGIIAAATGGSLDVNGSEWFFRLQARLTDYAGVLTDLASTEAQMTLPPAVQAMTILRHISNKPGKTVRDSLSPMLEIPPQSLNPAIRDFIDGIRSIREEALIIIRDHATAAKGAGKPSVLDIGLLYRDISSHLGDRSVTGSSAGTVLDRFRLIQSRTFNRMWTDVGAAVKRAQVLLDPGEDLPRTIELVDRLVAVGIGHLPRADFATTYREARAKLRPDSMDVYRQLTKKMSGETGPGDLWDIYADPLPQLDALIRYATLTNELLDGMAQTLAQPQPGGGQADVGALIDGFRGLADLLDDMARSGGQ